MGLRPVLRYYDQKQRDDIGDECLSRVPYASIIATSMCTIGVILFTLVMTWAFNATVEQARRILNVENLPWLANVIHSNYALNNLEHHVYNLCFILTYLEKRNHAHLTYASSFLSNLFVRG